MQCFEDGLTYQCLVDKFDSSLGQISRLINKAFKNGNLDRKTGSGRKTSPQDDRQILLSVKRNRFISSRNIQKELGLEIACLAE